MILRKRWPGPLVPRRPPTALDQTGGLPIPPPPAWLREQAAARWRLSSSSWDPAPVTPRQRLGRTLYERPPISYLGGESAMRRLARSELTKEVEEWRRACADAYVDLAGPLKAYHSHFRNKMARTAAHTIRLLMVLGHYHAAKELDRAFFTSLPPPPPFTPSPPRPPPSKYATVLKDGLKIDRGNIQLAWQYSLALRLRPGLYEDPDEVRNFLDSMQKAHLETGFSPLMISYLVSNAEKIVLNLMAEEERQASEPDELEEMVDAFLMGVRDMDQFVGEPAVEKSLLDMEMERLETKPRFWKEDPRLRLMEQEVRILLAAVDDSALSHRTKDLERRAHTIHTAIRVLLLRARISSSDSPLMQRRGSPTSAAIIATLGLYDQLLATLSASIGSPHLPDIQMRQASAFNRTLWACIGTLDPRLAPEALHEDHEEICNVPRPDPASINLCYAAIETTLAALHALPDNEPTPSSPLPSPRALRIPNRFWKRLLLVLSVPAAPSRTRPAASNERTPWPVLKRALGLILECKRHDSVVLNAPKTTAAEKARKSLFKRTAIVYHVVRATLLGGTDEGGDSEGSPEERLGVLLDFFRDVEGFDESVNRNTVRSAVEEVLYQEWKGAIWGEWKRELRSKVVLWAERRELRWRQ